MPMDRSKYPADWEAISLRIRHVRAESRCECKGDCGLSHAGSLIEAGRCERRNGDPLSYTGKGRVVLTVAHLCRDSACADETHMRAMCQRCHLRYDGPQHARNAAATRQRKRDESSGQLALEVKDA